MPGLAAVLVYVTVVVVLLATYKIVKLSRDRRRPRFGDADAYEGNLVTPPPGEHDRAPTAGRLPGWHGAPGGRRSGDTGGHGSDPTRCARRRAALASAGPAGLALLLLLSWPVIALAVGTAEPTGRTRRMHARGLRVLGPGPGVYNHDLVCSTAAKQATPSGQMKAPSHPATRARVRCSGQ